jgi:hypothetical protein
MTLEDIYKDVYARLSDDAALTGKIGPGKVFDFEAVTETPGPYIVIGDTHETEGRTLDGDERKVSVRLHIWSKYRGRKEIIEIEREAERAMSGPSATGEEYLFESFQVLMDDDGWMHGVLVMRIYIERG